MLLLAQLADKIGMCLTIPKKVVSREGDFFVVESPTGARQKIKSMVSLKAGEYCLTQQNIAVEKIDAKEALEIINIIKSAEKI